MNKLKDILKVSALNLFGINQTLHSRNHKEKYRLIGFSFLFFFVGVSVLFLSFFYSYAMAASLHQLGADLRILPALMMAVCCVITLFTTIYKASSTLFHFQDYDLLMSLPIQTRVIVASRLILLYAFNLVFCFLVMVPAAVVYVLWSTPSWTFYPLFLLCFLIIPLVPIIVATLLGMIVSLIASRFRHSSIITLILTILFTVGAIVLSFQMQNIIMDLGNISTMLMDAVNRIYPLAQWFARAVCDADPTALMWFAGVSLGLFALFVLLVGKKFKMLHTLFSEKKTASSSYHLATLKSSSPLSALYKKEGKRFLSSPLYMMNTSIGIILMILACIALLVMRSQIPDQLYGLPTWQLLRDYSPLILSFFVIMSSSTSSSISLEGKNLWVLKSLPLSTRIIFLSKIGVSLTYMLPGVFISALLLSIALQPNLLQSALFFLLPAAFALFISCFGLLINLIFPNFSWKSEVTVIKQSVAVLVTLLGGMVLVALAAILCLGGPIWNPTLLLSAITAVVLLITFFIWQILKKKGSVWFSRL